MATETICTVDAFVNDTAFYKILQAATATTTGQSNTSSGNMYSAINQGYCCADDAVSTYFADPEAIAAASGSTRLSLGQLIEGRTLGGTFNGSLSLHIDGSSTLTDSRWLDVFEDPDVVSDLFKAIELVGYGHKYSSTGNGSYTLFTVAELQTKLASMFTNTTTSDYPASAPHLDASATDTADASGSDTIPTAQTVEGTTHSSVPVRVRRNATLYLTKAASGSTDATVKYIFHLYFQKEYFLENYPNSVITNVITPVVPLELYNFTSTFSIMSSFVEKSTKYVSENTGAIMKADNHSGIYTLTTQYNCVVGSSTNGDHFNISFSVVYKGHKPTYAQAISAIKGVLEGAVPDTTGWKLRLPGLYYQVSWYLVPLYNHQYRANNSSSTAIPSNIYCAKNLEQIARAALTASRYDGNEDYLELIKMQRCDYMIVAVPDTNNGEDFKYLSSMFPNCTGYLDQNTSSYQGSALATNVDKLINKLLIAAEDSSPQTKASNLAVGYKKDEDNLEWIYGSNEDVQLYVLTKSSLLSISPVSTTDAGGPSVP